VRSPELGSTDGFNVAARTIAGIPLAGAVGRNALFVLACLIAFVSAAILHRYLGSHLGRLTPAIRDNELRVEYLGRPSATSCTESGDGRRRSPERAGRSSLSRSDTWTPRRPTGRPPGSSCSWPYSPAPAASRRRFVGAALLELLRNFAYAHAPNTWQLVVGGVMLLVILFLPEGLWSLFRRRRAGEA